MCKSQPQMPTSSPSAKAAANMLLGDHKDTILHDGFRWIRRDAQTVKARVGRGQAIRGLQGFVEVQTRC